MTRKKWQNTIKQASIDAGTYKPFFDAIIDTLADILEKRDKAQKEFNESGKKIIVEHTNKAGATNFEQNPLIRLINDLNRDALAYWKELGLTAASLKRINESAIKGEKKLSPLEKALKELEN